MIVHAWSEDLLSHFKAYIDIQEEYNSNINLSTNRYRQDDFITTITPGFIISTAPKSPVTGQFLKTPTAEKNYGIDLDFRAGFNFYAKHHEENYISLNGLLNAWYALSNNLNFRVREYLIRSDDIRELDYSASAIQGQYLRERAQEYLGSEMYLSLYAICVWEKMIAIDPPSTIEITSMKSRRLWEDSENFINNTDYWFDIRNGVSFQYGLIKLPEIIGFGGLPRALHIPF
jgi:hypothetical protein